ncbi:MAG TPA: protein kinase [Acidobacteriota bacterium]|nr:protein kinase [Acidobacteriota bacterium]
MVGKTLAHYRIIQVLGTGGMGEVYLALDEKLDRPVALKILPTEVASDADRMRRFVQEARAASALDHPNVAHIYEIGEADGIHFIAMQYVEGVTLNTRLDDKPLPIQEALNIAIQVADALTEAHSRGVIHRDIKPANIMINNRGQVRVVDFGLAKINPQSTPESITAQISNDPPTRTGVIIGTIHYLSPEQAMGKAVDGRSDLFSLGVVLYQMTTGKLPFGGETAIEMMHNILRSDPDSPGRHNKKINPELERIIAKAMAKDPDRRYASADEMLRDLRHLKQQIDSGVSDFKINPFAQLPKSKSRSIYVALFLVAAAIGVYIWKGQQKPIDSIAILPFVNVNGDSETEYLSDGITEGVINTLSQIPQLRVMARSTVFAYKGKQIPPQKIGKDLKVGAVLTGTVSHRNDNLSVQAELVDVKDGAQIWGDQYNSSFSSILHTQEEIAREISDGLQLKLTGEEEERLKKHYTENTEAYDLYLKGRYYWNKRTSEGFRKAIDQFNLAIQKDPDYALAYAGLADCYTLLPAWAFMKPSEAHPKATKAAAEALELDESLAEAHTALGHTLHNYEWRWTEAEREYQRAIQLNPNYAIAHHWYSDLLSDLGRGQEAIAEKQRALRLDPLSLVINADFGNILYHQRRYDEAIVQLQKTLELDSNFPLAYQFLGYVYEARKRYDEELAAFRKGLQISPNDPELKADLARALALSGQKQEARKMLEELLELSKEQYIVAYEIAMIYDALGQKDETFEWLGKAVQERSYQVSSMAVDPRLDPLRSDPRFKKLIAELHL